MTFLYEPPKPPRKVKAVQRPSPNSKAAKTLEHLAAGWVPVNPESLALVTRLLSSGAGNREQILRTIKEDPGLFLYCTRSIQSVRDQSSRSLSPLEELRTLEDEKLFKLLDIKPEHASAHSLRDASKHQALRIQHSLVSTKAVEELASAAHLSQDIAYSGVAFRQLGMTLLAWNYPRIYSRALSLHRRSGASLDIQFKNLLGLTPGEIGARFASRWKISPEIQESLRQPRVYSGSKDVVTQGVSLHSICTIAELAGRLSDPVSFPTAQKEWDTVKPVVTELCGDNFIERIEADTMQTLATIQSIVTAVSSLPLAEPIEFLEDAPSVRTDALAKNRYVRRCPESIQHRFQELYKHIDGRGVAVDAVRVLVDSLIPDLGFARGCLYLEQKDRIALAPALRIGELPLEAYTDLPKKSSNGIMAAMSTRAPFRIEGSGVKDEQGTHICGRVDAPNHPGVLYLELHFRAAEDPDHDSLLYFNVVKEALMHCIDPGSW